MTLSEFISLFTKLGYKIWKERHIHFFHAMVMLSLLLLGVIILSDSSNCFDPFTYVVIPDTQYYSAWWNGFYNEQTYWICHCSERLNIVGVSHLGDIVEHDNQEEREWIVAYEAMHTLFMCDIPLGIIPGNHDSALSKERVTDFTLYNKYFSSLSIGQSFPNETMLNNYFTFLDSSGKNYLSLNIQYTQNMTSPQIVLKWASDVIASHPHHNIILSTHFAGKDCINSVNSYVKRLVYSHCNIVIIFGGHEFACDGENIIPVKNKCGETRYVLVSNYQHRGKGGHGLLRYYRFEEEKVCAFTYSPTLHEFEDDKNSFFSINLRDNTLGSGCSNSEECESGYISPGHTLGLIWIATTNAIALALVWDIIIYTGVL